MTSPDLGDMKLVVAPGFDTLQRALVGEIIRTVRTELERVDAPPELVAELSGAISFAVASVIDDTAGLEIEGRAVRPMLAFQLDDTTLGWAGGNSWMHEYVFRMLSPDLTEGRGSGA